MVTTVQVSESTKQLLERLKGEERASSYNEVIERLAKEHARVPESMFGSIKKGRWKKEDRMKFHEL